MELFIYYMIKINVVSTSVCVGILTYCIIILHYRGALLAKWCVVCALISDCIIVKYIGEEPVCLVLAAHGNSTTDRPYMRAWTSVLEQIKTIAATSGGHTGPADLNKEAVTSAPSEEMTWSRYIRTIPASCHLFRTICVSHACWNLALVRNVCGLSYIQLQWTTAVNAITRILVHSEETAAVLQLLYGDRFLVVAKFKITRNVNRI